MLVSFRNKIILTIKALFFKETVTVFFLLEMVPPTAPLSPRRTHKKETQIHFPSRDLQELSFLFLPSCAHLIRPSFPPLPTITWGKQRSIPPPHFWVGFRWVGGQIMFPTLLVQHSDSPGAMAVKMAQGMCCIHLSSCHL